MPLTLRSRYVFLPLALALVTITLLTFHFSNPLSQPAAPPPPEPEKKRHPLYKPPKPDPPPPLPEYFPLAASAKSPTDLPPVPSWNTPPKPHVPENTRLYIGFTRFWPLLQQVVISYITAGWPPEDIYVVENTGTFDANKNAQLTSSNPFYMDYHRLTEIFGVNVLTTPSLQTFAQLQNLYLSEAINNNLTHYFWSHMDVVAQTHEDAKPFKSLYQIAVDTIRESFAPDYPDKPWAIRFFSYDWLALVNVESYIKVGGWDSMIGYYGTDCDMHSRLSMNGLKTPIADAGQVFDVGKSLPDLEVLYRRKKKAGARKREEKITGSTFDDVKQLVDIPSDGSPVTVTNLHNDTMPPPSPSSSTLPTSSSHNTPSANKAYLDSTEEDTIGSENWSHLQDTLEAMAEDKRQDPYRNSWQLKQRGGQGEPFYYDPDGWEQALQMTIEVGGKIMHEKWGHIGCDLRDTGLSEGDQWRVEHDWD